MINKIKKTFLNSVNKLTKIIKKFIAKNKHKINWHSIKSNKKKWIIGLFMIGYVIFWLWYFSERNISFQEQPKEIEKSSQIETESKKEQTEEPRREFTKEELGNFWLEVDTDKFKVKAPIVQGTEPVDLKKGIGRHRTTALPGENGNMVISGHRWKFGNNPAYKAFENLDELKNGDKITVHYGNEDFEYEIFEEGIVRDDGKGFDEVMKKTDEQMLTLYTCTPKYTALKRLYYRARIIK